MCPSACEFVLRDQMIDARFDFASGTYQISGSGANVWGTADAFQFVWKRMSGDMAITSDVQSAGPGKIAKRKAVLMFRQSLDADSAHADVAVRAHRPTTLQFQPSAGVLTQKMSGAQVKDQSGCASSGEAINS